MAIEYSVLIGYANGDVHRIQVMKDQDASLLAVDEAKDIGNLTNAGFRTFVASVWSKAGSKTAGFLYAAAWQENEVQVLRRFGDRIATSKKLFQALAPERSPSISATELLRFCHESMENPAG